MSYEVFRRGFIGQATILVTASTLVLTASFIGFVSLVSGQAAGIGDRLAFYMFSMAVVFIVTLFLLEDTRSGGWRILVTTVGVSVVGFLLILLSGEGLLYLVEYPERILASHLIIYLISAGLICTGLGYWSLRHWREFTKQRTQSLRR